MDIYSLAKSKENSFFYEKKKIVYAPIFLRYLHKFGEHNALYLVCDIDKIDVGESVAAIRDVVIHFVNKM